MNTPTQLELPFLEPRPVEEPKPPLSLGAVYTPQALAQWVAGHLVGHMAKLESPLVLDPACGDGALLEAFVAKRPETRVVGLDVDPGAVAATQAQGLRAYQLDTLQPSRDTQPEFFLQELLGPVDAVIANPPWGADVPGRDALERLGYTLASGRFDSYELFLELCLRVVGVGAPLAFIVPDSLFLPEHEPLRRLLLTQTRLHLVARLGEGFFPGVCRGTVVLVFSKGAPPSEARVRCLRLDRSWRRRISRGEATLADAERALVHEVPQARFLEDPGARLDIDVQEAERTALAKLEVPPAWEAWFEWGGGHRISKTGRVYACPNCGTCAPTPRKPDRPVRCRCGSTNRPAELPLRRIVRRLADQPAQEGWTPLIVGEDVDRYHVSPSREVELGVPGIRYQPKHVFKGPRLLVRKTGVGLKAAIEERDRATNQVVYHCKLRTDVDVPEFALYYALGVLSSRVLLAYHLRRGGENEWRSHPYVTPGVLKRLPLPLPVEGTWTWTQAQAIAEAARACQAAGRDLTEELDLRVECLVAGLYELDLADCAWVNDVLASAQQLQAIRSVRLSDPRLLAPRRISP